MRNETLCVSTVGFEALFETVKQEGDPISGLWKDTVAVEPFSQCPLER
jgi:hypothetical protein